MAQGMGGVGRLGGLFGSHGPRRRPSAVHVLATCAALFALSGCPETTPDSGQFAAADGAGQELDGPSGSDSSANDSAADSSSDTPSSETTDVASTTDGSTTDIAAPADGDTTTADSPSGTDASTDVNKDTDSTSQCGCSSTAECAGIAVAVCQVAVCKSCSCLVEWAAEGSPCGSGNACQKGQCLPKAGPGPWATAIAAGGRHSCARHPDGSASCWGLGSGGQIGNGATTSVVKTPKLVSGLLVIDQLSAGNSHTCARHDGGKVSCWGDDFSGQIGSVNTDDEAPVPQQAGTLADAISIATGTYGSFAIRKGATLWGWGKNLSGQIGTGGYSTKPVNAAVQVEVTDVAGMACGQGQTCAVRSSGEVLCWGDNDEGQSGSDKVGDVYLPQLIALAGKASAVAVGISHGCALRQDGAVLCWGKGTNGELGDGLATSSAKAVVVVGSGKL